MKPLLLALLTPFVALATTPAERTVAWKQAEPADALPRGEWWTHFADPVLDELIAGALAGNQDLRAAAARVEQARAVAGLARSNYWPQVAAQGDFHRERSSSTTDSVLPRTITSTYQAPLSASWELDLFGRVRHLSASARAEAEATAAEFESVRLALTSDVAATYFTLRAIDRELALVRAGVQLRRRARELAEARYRNGTSAELDLARADAELATTEAEAIALANQRASIQSALAVLLGAPAPEFRVTADDATPRADGSTSLPAVPSDLPASLLERRSDVAAAERALAAANARIGVAKAAFFPAISLTGGAGFASADVDGLFKTDSRIWSIGPSIYLPIFQGGRNRTNLARSQAAHDEAVAAFRQRVLIAFREVHDALTATELLAGQAAAQERALAAARRATTLAQTRYDAGFVSFLEVIDAQRTALTTERASVQLEALRLNTRVALIKALGGSWSSAGASPALAHR